MAAYIFYYHYWRKGCYCHPEAWNTANHPIMHRQFPTTEGYQAQNVNNAQAVKPWFKRKLYIKCWLFTMSHTK